MKRFQHMKSNNLLLFLLFRSCFEWLLKPFVYKPFRRGQKLSMLFPETINAFWENPQQIVGNLYDKIFVVGKSK
ncbi:hypothetical protein ACT3CD_01335 [Geofilum sp. OHC36d9]|uniref:hypothetical protein n=1 Tax=Geofilum sp. OHC36d9 TaxID=3458413 RepID=UPI004033C300